MDDKKQYRAVLLIVLCGLAAYANSLGGAFVLDDHLLIVENRFIKHWPDILRFFAENIGSGAQANWGFYRPLQMMTYGIDYVLWGLNPVGYHLTNVILHILVGLSLWRLITTLFHDGLLAVLTGMLFVVNPLHTEAVTYISGRADSLVFLCMAASLIAYARNIQAPRRSLYLAALISYIGALFSRENSLVFPLVLLLYHAACNVRLKSREYTPVIAVTFLYIALRRAFFNFQEPDAVGFMQRLPGVLVATTNYVLLLIAPVGLHMEYGKKLFSWGDWRVFAGAALLSALIVSIMRARKKSSIIFFGLGFFLITLLPQTNLLYPINAYMAEHWLYVPSMGILLIAAGAFCRLYRREHGRGTAIALIMLLIFSHIVLTLYQNSYWRNPISLYEATLRYAPRSSRIMVYLGDELSKQKDFEGATALYQKAIAIEPSANAYYNLGNTFRLQGRNSDAIAAYRHATEHDSRFVRAYYNLGGMFLLEKDYAQAAAAYRKALELDPSNMQAKKYVDELSVTRAH